MTVIVFLVDSSASMMQRTYQGTTFLDFAKQAVEQFLKQRQRDAASNGDRYMLMTFEDYPMNVKSGWKEGQRMFTEQLKNLKVRGMAPFESALSSAIRFVNLNRLPFVEVRENYGFGRYPSHAEFVIIVSIVDGTTLPPKPAPDEEVKLPKPKSNGSELTVEPIRWDQRLFTLVLRMPGQQEVSRNGAAPAPIQVPAADDSQAEAFSAMMGGRSFAIHSHKSLGPAIDAILQRIQTNGVLVKMEKYGPDPAPLTPKDGEVVVPFEDGDSWKSQLTMVKCRLGNISHWPIPEPYWPDSVGKTLTPRHAHPTILFKCEPTTPITNRQLMPWDSYELEKSSLTQYILSRRDPNACWQVFIASSSRHSGPGLPFGYLKASTSLQSVGIFLLPYNFSALLPLLEEAAKDPKQVSATNAFRQRFDKYLATVPQYYYKEIKTMLARHQINIPALEDAVAKLPQRLYVSCDLARLTLRIKHLAQKEFDGTCQAVTKQLAQDAATAQNVNCVVHASRSRVPLGKQALTECRLRPALRSLKAQIPDLYKDLGVCVLDVTPTAAAAAPSNQFKNPFDIPRHQLVEQLVKMRINFDQQVSASYIHLLEGGLPGQKIKLQHAEDLHSQPIAKMGVYEDYVKSLASIGLGPRRELEEARARPHAFGNPFKLDKRNNMSVDEVGEAVNATAPGSSSGNNGTKETAAMGRKRAASEPTAAGTSNSGPALPRLPRRKPGPLDKRHLDAWKRKRRASSASFSTGDMDDDEVASVATSDISDLSSLPDEGDDLEEDDDEIQRKRRRTEDEADYEEYSDEPLTIVSEEDDEEIRPTSRIDSPLPYLAAPIPEQPPPQQQRQSTAASRHSAAPTVNGLNGSASKSSRLAPNNHYLQSQRPTTTTAPAPSQRHVSTATFANGEATAKLTGQRIMKRPKLTEPTMPSTSRPPQQHPPPRDVLSDKQLQDKQREIIRVVRQFATRTELFDRCLIVTRDLSPSNRHTLLGVAARESRRFKRNDLAALLERELQSSTS